MDFYLGKGRWRIWLVILSITLWLIFTTSNALDGCFTGQFTYSTRSACSSTNCAGVCVNDYSCCTDECFSITDFAAQSTCKLGYAPTNETNEIKCRTTLQEIDCVANFSQSTFDICYRQVVDLVERGAAQIVGVDPVNCPCNESHTKIEGACILNCEAGRCYNTTDVWTDEPACCINNNILPIDSDCVSGEERIPSVVSMTFDLCQAQCVHTCRQAGFGRLPVCCRNIYIPPEAEKKTGVSGGIIALIVIMVVVLITVLAVMTVWFLRKRASGKSSDAI